MEKLKILLVEDNAIAQRMMNMLLTMDGHEIAIADCGLKALQMATNDKFDVIFIDIGLPDITGIEVAKQLVEKLPTIKDKKQPILLALTANTDEGIKEQCFAVGMHGFLDKPFTIEKMAAALTDLL